MYQLLARPVETGKPRAAVLVGLRITGRLNLEAAELQASLIAHNCYFDEPVNLMAATAAEIRLTACQLLGIAADQLQTRGDLDLRNSTLGLVDLLGVHIGGSLDLSGATLTGGSYPLDLGGGTLRPPERPTKTLEGIALNADGLQVDGGMFCRGGFSAEGAVRLPRAHIAGQLSFDGAVLSQGLDADGLQVDGGMFCRGDFRAEGAVRLPRAHIASSLDFDNATLSKGLNADGVRVDGGMFCRGGFSAEGAVRLVHAHIAGALEFNGARLSEGLTADALRVDGDMFCRGGLIAKGTVGLRGAHIAGALEFDGAVLSQGLNAEGLRVDGNMFCRGDFRADGTVRLCGAHIAGQLSFERAMLTNAVAADLDRARVEGDVFLRFAEFDHATGMFDLTGARLGRVFDRESTWPAELRLRGCVYASVQAVEDATQQRTEQLEGEARQLAWLWRRLGVARPPDVQRRLRWIRLAEDGQLDHRPWWRRLTERTGSVSLEGDGYAPQPYTQLMAFYRQEGRDGDARRVAYERERRRSGQLGVPGKAWNAFLRWTVGYGYKPLRALLLLGVLVVIGTFVFDSFHSAREITAVRAQHPPFQATIYTLDRLIPVVTFGLRDAFAPRGAAQWWAFAYTLLGWTLSLAVIAGLNAAVRRD